MDYLTPFYITSIILIGYLISVVMIVISKWSFLERPTITVVSASVGLIILAITATLLFQYMEMLKQKLGIRSTWKRVRGGEMMGETDADATE